MFVCFISSYYYHHFILYLSAHSNYSAKAPFSMVLFNCLFIYHKCSLSVYHSFLSIYLSPVHPFFGVHDSTKGDFTDGQYITYRGSCMSVMLLITHSHSPLLSLTHSFILSLYLSLYLSLSLSLSFSGAFMTSGLSPFSLLYRYLFYS